MLRRTIAVFTWLGLLASLTFAQVTGRISGSVVDATGAAVLNAQIQLMVSGGQAAIFTTTTNNEGIFAFAGVQPGKYDVSVNASGFGATKVQVEVSPIRETTVPPIKMAVVAAQAIEVVASSSQVQTANAEVLSTITNTQIDKLPLLDRTVIDLALTQPGVVNASPISNGTDIVVNGLRSTY